MYLKVTIIHPPHINLKAYFMKKVTIFSKTKDVTSWEWWLGFVRWSACLSVLQLPLMPGVIEGNRILLSAVIGHHIASGKFQHADRVKQITSYTVMKQPCSHDPLKWSYGHHGYRTHPPRAVGPDVSGEPQAACSAPEARAAPGSVSLDLLSLSPFIPPHPPLQSSPSCSSAWLDNSLKAKCLCSAQAFQTLKPVALVFIWCVAWGKLCSFSVPHPPPLQGEETKTWFFVESKRFYG